MSTSSSNDNRMVFLKSNDGKIFEVDEIVASEALTIKHMIEDVTTANTFPLPNVTGKILSKVIEYCKKHAPVPKSTASQTSIVDDELKAFDAEFIKVDRNTLFDLIIAANYLNIKGLLDLGCQRVTDMIEGMNPEEIPKTFNIKNDLTPGEEAEVRMENN